MGTESDPVIIAQRLLNLYRQLHIFSPEKKEAYNKMLMEQTPEVKKTLGSLPGGIVVQQYLADIEAEAGVAVEEFEHEAPQEDVNANYYNGAGPRVAIPANISVASDPEMIKEIVETFKEAMVTSEKNRKEDTKELAQTIIALQSKMVQAVMSKNRTFSSGSATGGGGYNSSDLESIVETISKAQSELIKDLASTQTKELTTLIGNVLKEIQQMSTQSMIDVVQKVHRENMDFFKNQIFTTVSSMPISHNMGEPISLDGYDDYPAESSTQKENKKKSKEEAKSEDNFEEPISLDNTDFSSTTENTEGTTGEEENGDEYEWEYVEEEDTSSAENTESTSEENGEEYEWEYVDEGENSTAEGGEYAGDDNGEYEYEYVEDDGSVDSGEYEYVEDTSLDGAETQGYEDQVYDNQAYDDQANNDNYPATEESNTPSDEEEFPDQIELDDSFGISSNDDI